MMCGEMESSIQSTLLYVNIRVVVQYNTLGFLGGSVIMLHGGVSIW